MATFWQSIQAIAPPDESRWEALLRHLSGSEHSEDLFLHGREIASLEPEDAVLDDGDSVCLGELLCEPSWGYPQRISDRQHDRELAQKLLGSLDARSREVIALRYGLVGGEGRTLQEVGDHFGLTREPIRQIEVKAIERMRRIARVEGLSVGSDRHARVVQAVIGHSWSLFVSADEDLLVSVLNVPETHLGRAPVGGDIATAPLSSHARRARSRASEASPWRTSATAGLVSTSGSQPNDSLASMVSTCLAGREPSIGRVLALRYGIASRPLTPSEIAQRIGLSLMRTYQIQNQGVAFLRSNLDEQGRALYLRPLAALVRAFGGLVSSVELCSELPLRLSLGDMDPLGAVIWATEMDEKLVWLRAQDCLADRNKPHSHVTAIQAALRRLVSEEREGYSIENLIFFFNMSQAFSELGEPDEAFVRACARICPFLEHAEGQLRLVKPQRQGVSPNV